MENRRISRSKAKSIAAPALQGWFYFFAMLATAAALSFAQLAWGQTSLTELERQVWVSDEEEFAHLEQSIAREMQLNPYSGFAHYLMAHLYVRKFSIDPSDMKLLRRASELGQQAIEIESNKDYGYVVIAEILDLMGQPANGVKILTPATNSMIRDSWRTYFIRARLQSDLLRPSQILGFLGDALLQKETQPEVIIPYVVALLKNENAGSELVARLGEWYERHPNELFLQTQALTLADMEQYTRAHAVYEKIYRKNPNYKEAMINDAILLADKLNRPNDSVRLLEKVLKQFPHLDQATAAVVHAQLGIINLQRNQDAKAEAHFFESLQRGKDEPEMLELIASKYRSLKKPTALAKLLNRLADELPGNSTYYGLLGEILSEDLSSHQKAIEAYGNAIALEPERSDYYNGLGLTFYRMENMQQALTFFSAATKIDPDDASARYNEACALARLGRNDEALGSLKEAIALNPKLQQSARTDKDFDGLKHTEQFEKIVVKRPVASKRD